MQIKRGDVVLAEASYNEKYVEKKPRPYLIVSNNACNQFANVVVGIPFTTAQKKRLLPTHYRFWYNNKMNIALAEYPTLISKYKIYQNMGKLKDKHIKEIENRLKVQLDVKD